MYSSYPINSQQSPMYPNQYPATYPNTNDDRYGGFAVPFILGGITGGLISPLFTGGYNRPYYYSNNYYYPPYYYRPY